MALVKSLSKVDKDSRIAIPKNIRKEAGLKEDQLVEIKVQGSMSVNIKAHKKAVNPFKKQLSYLI
jgi:bifunctional DNA-binding transcriptional regulator/antitoxin component of YhaV-PrlF toxin-antitoxin module